MLFKPNSRVLLLMNYSMDTNDHVLSHQFDVAISLTNKFDKVIVLSTAYKPTHLPNNLILKIVNWKKGRNLRNAFYFYKEVIPIILKYKPKFVFSHMLPIQSVLISPITKLFQIKNSLWYAHAERNVWFSMSEFFADTVISSTNGSCPTKRKKPVLIGQGLKSENFSYLDRKDLGFKSFVYFGRMSKSKNVDLIIESLDECREIDKKILLLLIGDFSYNYITDLNKSWLTCLNSVNRKDIPKLTSKCSVFIHAYSGSLDKVLVEATLMGMAVISINEEFLNEYECFGSEPHSLTNQVLGLISSSDEEVARIITQNYYHSLTHHDFNGWINRLYNAIIAKH